MRPIKNISLICLIGPIFFWVAVVFLLLITNDGAFAHGTGDELYPDAGLDERPGNTIPPDLSFSDEQGKRVLFRGLVDKPAILTLVYYSCDHICPQMLGGLAGAVGGLHMAPGKDYTLITVSFDEGDTPKDALDQKRNYIKAAGMPLPEGSWKFLTGDRENIKRLSDAVGIRFKRESHGFIHPEVLVFLSPGGRITGYRHVTKYAYGTGYPVTFSPVDLERGLSDAAPDNVWAGSGKVPLYCFHYEPERQEKFFSILRISGGITLLSAIALFIYLAKAKHG